MKLIQVPQWECKRCGHVWIGRRKDKPTKCPKCNSGYWDRDVERQSVIDANKKRFETTYRRNG